MTDMDQAVGVATSVTIDWAELGRVFADESSPQQAAFFMGFYEGVVDAQLAYIGAEKIFDVDRDAVAGVFAALAEFIGTPL